MYKVMMVDDDYPVLELLSDSISWEKIGCTLHGVHENGLSAYEHAQENMPDILITDIGMPKMSGIELVRKLKPLKPNLLVIILSCHSEFDYAKQALQLNVQDYMLKDAFVPADLQKKLLDMTTSLNEEKVSSVKINHLQLMADRNRMMLKRHFLRDYMHQPLLNPSKWLEEAANYGLNLREKSCLPIIGYLDHYTAAKQRYRQDDVMSFAISNVVDEILDVELSEAVFITCDVAISFLLIPFIPNLKINIFDQARRILSLIQVALKDHLKLSMTFIVGAISEKPNVLQTNLNLLLNSKDQRFYLQQGEIASFIPKFYNEDDLFAKYHQAMIEFRTRLMEQPEKMEETIKRWISVIRHHQYAPEVVKDWVLKLLLDIRLKIQALQHFRRTNTAEVLYKEMSAIDSLYELEGWLIRHLKAAAPIVETIKEQSTRSEVQSAYRYVARHIDQRITLDEIANHLHLNASYFSRLFKKETGETFIEYVTRIKMDRAKELLDQTTFSVGEICGMLGYDNHSYFIKTFKAAVGMTPAEYREWQQH